MEITRDNFGEEAFEIVTEAIKDCEFMAFDTEFTGFYITEEDRGHDYDSIEDRYQKLKYVCSRCKAIQFGLTTFKWEPRSKEYIAQSFNFYILKNPKPSENYAITMKPDCMNFLANFDFKKLYTSGITYERLSEKEKVISEIKSGEHEFHKMEKDRKNIKILSKDHNAKKKEILKDVKEMAYGDETELSYNFESYLLKQKLSDAIKEKYKGIYTSFRKNSNDFVIKKKAGYVPPHEQVNSIQDSLFDDEESKDDDVFSEDALNLKRIEKSHSAKFVSSYRQEMGFSLVIEEMMNSHKPLIGHNCIYDMCFVYDQFIGPLPDTFREFTEEWRNCFQETYDSKHITSQYVGRLFQNTKLESLYKKCRKDKSLRNMISYSIDSAPVYKRYQSELKDLLTSLQVEHAHEAGFDSYMAGCVFLTTSKYREIGAMMEAQKLAKKNYKKNKKYNGKRKKREIKAEDKDTASMSQLSSVGHGRFWVDLRGERIDLSPMDQYKNKVVFDLNGRFFDLSEDFNGKEENFDTSNVIWISWAKRKAPTIDEENWVKDRISYSGEKINIVVSKLAEILSQYGDVTIVKDSQVSAFVEFTSFDPRAFKRTARVTKQVTNIFKVSSVLKEIADQLRSQTGIKTFEVHPYEKAQKFSSRYIHE